MRHPATWRIRCLVLLCLCVHGAWGRWVQTNGPLGGNVRALAVMGNTVLAGVGYNGVYASHDGGETWSVSDSGMPGPGRGAFAFQAYGSVLLAGTGWGVFLSRDSGSSWEARNSGLPLDRGGLALAVSGGLTYVAMSGAGVFVSADTGANWSAANNGLSDPLVSCLATVGSVVFAGTMAQGIFKSVDSGASWSPANGTVPDRQLQCLLTVRDTIYAGYLNGGYVWVSTDTGANWVTAGRSFGQPVFSMVAVGGAVLAGAWGAVHGFTYGDSVWARLSTGLPACMVGALTCKGDTMLAGTDDGVYRSADGGVTWLPVKAGMNCADVRALMVDSGVLYCGANGAGVCVSGDKGASWSSMNTGLSVAQIHDLALHGNGFYASSSSVIVYKSVNKGTSWLWPGYYLDGSSACLAVLGRYLIAGTQGAGVSVSPDDGSTWVTANNGLTNLSVQCLAVVGPMVYAGTRGGGVFVSGDTCATWARVSNGLRDTVVTCLAMGWGWPGMFAGTRDSGIFVERWWDSTWHPANQGLTDLHVTTLFPYGYGMFAGTTYGGVHFMRDPDADWIVANDGLEGYVVNEFAIQDSTLFAATTSGGVWSRPLREFENPVAAQTKPQRVPNAIRLDQRNGTLEVEFTLSTPGLATVRVYDLAGRTDMSLHSGPACAGRSTLRLSTRTLAPGCYTVVVSAGQQVLRRSLLIAR